MVAHFLCVLYTGFIIYSSRPGSDLFSWHPTLMAIAYGLLMAESILLFSPQSSLLANSARKTKVWYHLLGLWLAGCCAVAGWLVIFTHKNRKDLPHGATNHGRIGFITVVYTLLQCMAGMLLYFPAFSMKFMKYSKLKLVHVTSGSIMFSMACVSLILGMYSTWFVNKVTGTSWYACVACPSLLALIILNQVISSYVFKDKKAPTTAS